MQDSLGTCCSARLARLRRQQPPLQQRRPGLPAHDPVDGEILVLLEIPDRRFRLRPENPVHVEVIHPLTKLSMNCRRSTGGSPECCPLRRIGRLRVTWALACGPLIAILSPPDSVVSWKPGHSRRAVRPSCSKATARGCNPQARTSHGQEALAANRPRPVKPAKPYFPTAGLAPICSAIRGALATRSVVWRRSET